MNGVKSQPLEDSPAPATPQISGKLIIIGILTIAISGATVSWYFRYNATHRAARFWGGETATLIRDAPQVTLFRKPSADTIGMAQDNHARAIFDETAHDVSRAPGLLHLRNALLEDKNFVWPARGEPSPNHARDISYWVLSFHDPGSRKNPGSRKTALIMFSEDCRQAARQIQVFMHYELRCISTEPIAAGLREMFAEFSAKPASTAGEQSR